MGSNRSSLRDLSLRGVFLTDLTFIDENPDYTDGLINFAKRSKMYTTIAKIQRYQMQPYQLQVVPQIQRLFKEFRRLGDEELWKLSMQREPNGVTDASELK